MTVKQSSISDRLARAKAKRQEKREADIELLSRVPDDAEVPATSGQQRLWYLHQLDRLSPVYNIVELNRLSGPLAVDALEFAMTQAIARYETLRTALSVSEDLPVQAVIDPWSFEFDVQDYVGRSDQSLQEAMTAVIEQPFELSTAPLFRAAVFRTGKDEHVFLLVFHHSIFDGLSVDILFRSLAEDYDRFLAGDVAERPAEALRYRDFAAWQRDWLGSEAARTQLEFWTAQHDHRDHPLELPLDFPRPSEQSNRGSSVRTLLPASALQAFEEVLRGSKASPFMGLMAALSILLRKYTGQHGINIGVPSSGRTLPELEDIPGYFANTLVFHVKVDDDLTLSEQVDQVRDLCLASYQHQDLPFDALVNALDPARDMSRTPLSQVMLSFQDKRRQEKRLGDVVLSPMESPINVARTDLTFWVEYHDEGLEVVLEYSTDLFTPATAERILRHFERVIQEVGESGDRSVTECELLTEEDRTIQARVNGTDVQFEYTDTLALVEAVCRRQADQIAVVDGASSLTYGELMSRAAAIRSMLEAEGIEPGAFVGIHLQRSAWMVAAILGIWQAGCAYVPMDPDFPAARLEYMLEKSSCGIVLVDRDSDPRFHCDKVVDVTSLAPGQGAPGPDLAPASVAYTIFTSGSTGNPKGVMVPHGAVANFLQAMAVRPGFNARNSLLAVTTLSFDISVLELLLPLITGASVVIASKTDTLDGRSLIGLLKEHEVDTLQATPTTWRLLLSEGWQAPSGFRALCGGEALPEDLARELIDAGCELWNMYGPTETTVWSTCKRITRADTEITLGTPIANTRCHVLDETNRPLPLGVPGELAISGEGLSLGYLGEPALTSRAFVDVALERGEPPVRVYRTGDLVLQRSSGELLYRGRNDHQVKVRGFRIEIGDIEAALSALPGVAEAVVVVQTYAQEDARLVAYVRFADGARPTALELRRSLNDVLPVYMVPQQFVPLDEMPLTANGKVDRKALSKPVDTGIQRGQVVEPMTETERIIAGIWAELLAVDTVSTDSVFFDIGGHSLLSIRAIQRIEAALGVRPDVREMMLNTLQQLAAGIDSRRDADTGLQGELLSRVPDDAEVPATSGQQRLWYLHQLDRLSPVYNIVELNRLSGPLAVDALEFAMTQAIARYETLRTALSVSEDLPVQAVIDPWSFEFDVQDYVGRSDQSLQEAMTAVIEQPFELSTAPLFRAAVFRTGKDEHVFLLVFHHSIFDGLSVDILFRSLAEDYDRFLAGDVAERPAEALRYRDFAAWQRDWLGSEAARTQLEFWTAQHDHRDHPLELPLDFPRPSEQSNRGSSVRTLLPASALQAFEEVLRGSKASPFMGLMAALSILLRKYTGQHGINIGVPSSGRTLPELEDIPGYFANTLVFHVKVDDDLTLSEQVDQVRDLCLASYQHQDLPFDALVNALDPARDMSRTPLSQVMLSFQDKRRQEKRLGDVVLSPMESPINVARTDLTFWVEYHDEGLEVVLEYSTDLFTPATAERILRHFERVIQEVGESGDRSVTECELLTEEDRTIQARVNGTDVQFEYTDTLALVEAVCRRQADQIAVVDGASSLTYGELMSRAAAIRSMLEAEGIEPGAFVGIHLQRSAWMVAAILGIWQAGCAYVPMDPDFPAARLEYMLEKSSCGIVLVDRDSDPRFHCDKVVDVTSLAPGQGAPGPDLAPASVAYTIFTSGSTGNPKGVMVPHGAVANFLQAMAVRPGFNARNSLLAVTTLSFDISVLELLLPLITGASVVIASKTDTLDGRSLIGLLKEHEVDTLQATPTTWRLLLSEGWQAPSGFRALCGGEALPEDLARELIDAGCELWNMYGPTETTVWSTCKRITRADTEITLGTPIANTRCHVLDETNRPLPLGVPGELAISGEGLSLGYLGEPALTSRAFVDVALERGEPPVRVYRTGDLVLQRSSGELLYRGRNDHQVKVRGFRIEIGDIEAALSALPGVAEAVVVVQTYAQEDARLVAYVRFADGARPTALELRRSLNDVLPVYMVPQQFVPLDEMPLTANGKVDRKALSKPVDTGIQRGQVVEPMTETERIIAGIWAELLAVDTVSTDSVFFDIGGHSLLSIRAIQRIEAALGVRPDVREMMLNTLQQLAAGIDSRRDADTGADATPQAPGWLSRLRDTVIRVKRS